MATDQKIQYLQSRYRLSEWNTRHDPEDEQKRQAVRELFDRKEEVKRELDKWRNVPVPSPSEQEKKDAKIAAFEQEEKQVELEWLQARGDYLPNQVCSDGENSAKPAASSTPCQPVFAEQIRRGFSVFRDEDRNEKWWKARMGDADQYGLVECRVGAGKKGPGAGTLWQPDLIAGWLVDRKQNGRDGMSSSDAATALKKFPGCNDIANEMFPPDE